MMFEMIVTTRTCQTLAAKVRLHTLQTDLISLQINYYVASILQSVGMCRNMWHDEFPLVVTSRPEAFFSPTSSLQSITPSMGDEAILLCASIHGECIFN